MLNIISKFQASKAYIVVFSFFREDFFSNRLIRYPFFASVFTNIVMWIMILIKTGATNKPIPLHANAFYGVILVDSGLLFLSVPLIGMLLLVLNIFLTRGLYRTDRFLSVMFSFTTPLLQSLLFIASIYIILLNS